MKPSFVFLFICLLLSLLLGCFDDLPSVPSCFEDIESLEEAETQSIAICCDVRDDCIEHFVRQYGNEYEVPAQRAVVCDSDTSTCVTRCNQEKCECQTDAQCAIGQSCIMSVEQEVCDAANLLYHKKESGPGWCQLCIDVQTSEKDN